MKKYVPTSSVSQTNTFRSCIRKWVYSSVAYLPQEPRKATAFGDCLHEVLERWLDVDERGLKDGKVPDLYPEGWHLQKDYNKTKYLFAISEEDQQKIKLLVDKAISSGDIIRRPGAIVEYNEKIHITPDIKFTVRIDYAYDWTIEDHKSMAKWTYALTDKKGHARYLGKDLQLLIYSYFWANKRKRDTGEEIPEYLTIRHNQFCHGDLRIKTPSTKVKYTECVAAFEELKKDVIEQLEYRNKAKKLKNSKIKELEQQYGIKFWDLKNETKNYPTEDLTDKQKKNLEVVKDVERNAAGTIHMMAWQTEKNVSACGQYGKCPYLGVCNSQQMPQHYIRDINRKIDKLTQEVKKEIDMSEGTFDIGAETGATSAQADVVNEIVNSTPEVKEEVKSLQDLKDELEKNSSALSALGMDPTSHPDYDRLTKSIEVIEAAEVKAKDAAAKKEAEAAKRKAENEAAKKRAEEAEALAAAMKAEAKAQKSKAAEDKKVAAEKAKLQEDLKETADGPTDEVAIEKVEVMKQTKSKEITLLENGASVRGGTKVNQVSAQALAAKTFQYIADTEGVDSFYKLDKWDRKDIINEIGADVKQFLPDGVFVLSNNDLTEDEKYVVSALKKDPLVRVIG